MIPSDHFVRFYNEVFKTLEHEGHKHLVAYWHELGRLQTMELAERFRKGGLPAAAAYWKQIVKEENCEATLTETPDYFELRMRRCPSLSKVLDNDAVSCQMYCDHCMGWIEPVMEACGLHDVLDMESRTEPHCVFRVYMDRAAAEAFAQQARLVSRPYGPARDTIKIIKE
jgi:hypothetical protein